MKHDGLLVDGHGKANLTITDKRLIFEKKANILSRKSVPIITISAESLKNVKQIENFQIEIEYVNNSELKNVVLSSKSPTDSIEISQSLNSILNSYRKMRSEIEEAGKESKLSEVKFKNYILNLSIQIFNGANINFNILDLLEIQDWIEIDNNVKELEENTENMAKNGGVEMKEYTKDIENAVLSRSNVKVIDSINKYFTEMAVLLDNNEPPNVDWENFQSNSKINWSVVKYIFLFTITINHTIFNIRKNKEKIETLFSKLDDIANIIESIFDVKFENDFKEGEYEKNIKELDERKNTMKKLLDKQLENSFKEASMLI
ncbi:MAG: hypothetical protein VX368_01615 [Thermoproteota archaeon]